MLLAHVLVGRSNDVAVAALGVGTIVGAAVPPRRVQRIVDRLVYGDRADPYTVLAKLNAQLEAAIDPANVLPSLVQTLAESLRLPYVAVMVRRPGLPGVMVEHGPATVDTQRGREPGGDAMLDAGTRCLETIRGHPSSLTPNSSCA